VLKVLAPLLGLALAMTAHMINNALPLMAALVRLSSGEPFPEDPDTPIDMGFVAAFAQTTWLELVIFWPLILLMALAVWRSGVWERRVIRNELADEIGRSVTRDEYQDILRDRIFRTRRIDSDRPHISAALVNAQNELAFRKWRVRSDGNDPESDPLVTGWRADIARLRAVL
jgi:protease PrsW